MEDSDELKDGKDGISRLINALESNMGNLLAMRKNSTFLPEDGQSLEMVIEAQTQMLNKEANPTSGKGGMGDFVRGKCEAAWARQNRFIENWYDTNGSPCSKCGVDKSKCEFYQKLQQKG